MSILKITIICIVCITMISGCIEDNTQVPVAAYDLDEIMNNTVEEKEINIEIEFYRIKHTTNGINYDGWIVWNGNEHVFSITTHRGNGYIDGTNYNCDIVEYGVSEKYNCDITDSSILKMFINEGIIMNFDDYSDSRKNNYNNGYQTILNKYL